MIIRVATNSASSIRPTAAQGWVSGTATTISSPQKGASHRPVACASDGSAALMPRSARPSSTNARTALELATESSTDIVKAAAE